METYATTANNKKKNVKVKVSLDEENFEDVNFRVSLSQF